MSFQLPSLLPGGMRQGVAPMVGRRLSWTLTAYIAKTFMGWFGIMAFCVCGVILLASGLDSLNNFAGRVELSLTTALYFSLLKLPFIFQETLPFLILFASIGTFWRLVRSHELVSMRAAGVSVWQFLTPVIGCALGVGIAATTVLNPIAAQSYGVFQDMERRLLDKQESAMQLSGSGLWIRQKDMSNEAPAAQYVLHAQTVEPSRAYAENFIAFRYDEAGMFVERFDADSATLRDGAWRLRSIWVNGPDKAPRFLEEFAIPSDLDFDQIEESFAQAETVSFWNLRDFIAALERAGFSAIEHRLQFHKLLSLPLLLAAMAMLAATTSLRPHRSGRVGLLLLLGILVGFLVFILSNVIFALGLSGKIPIVLAAWTPAGVTMMFGAALLLHYEDG